MTPLRVVYRKSEPLGHDAFSVQYHPEASPGPHDAAYLFDRFVEMMNKGSSEG